MERNKTQLTFIPTNIYIGKVPAIKYLTYYNNNYIGEFSTFQHWDGLNICNFEIVEKYRGQHLAKQILTYAVYSLHCRHLAVEKINYIAYNLYSTFGFKITTSDEKYYYMSI